jgi:dTDP-glucose 4,6-dehydratase
MQEDMAIAWWRSFGVPMIITNTMNNFSEYQQPSKYPVIVQRALMNREKLTVHGTKGEMGTRYYIHSRNAADAVLFILKNCPPYQHKPGFADKPDRYNIVGDKQVDNLSLAQTIAKLMGKELEYELVDFHSTRPGHDLHYGLDGTKLRKKGWKSPLSFEESLKNTIEWQMNNQHWIT